jgi:hypothetical protein
MPKYNKNDQQVSDHKKEPLQYNKKPSTLLQNNQQFIIASVH